MKKLIAVIFLCAIAPSAALAAKSTLKLSPTTITAGQQVKVSGSVSGCKGPATISSKAFSAKHHAVSATLKQHKFSVKARISTSALSGSYKVSGRCGKSTFGTATLNVTNVY